MDNENITRPAYEKSKVYIKEVLKGKTKEQAKVIAGYSPNNQLVEHSKAYAVALTEIMTRNSKKMIKIADAIEKKVAEGALDKLTVTQLTDLELKTAQIHKILTPQVTIKEEQMKDGTTKRTVWGQGSVQGNTVEE